ncbi:MAG: hypothetical protein IT222_01525 [Crocinitomix sp.]|nr:hypothetical protein [Crocinitomix sp.]
MNDASKYIAYYLAHVHRISKSNINTKLIGIYDSTHEAEKAIELSSKLPGFKDSLDGYEIIPIRLNKIHWKDGFTEFIGENVLPSKEIVCENDKQLVELGLKKVNTVYHFFEHGQERNFEDEVRCIGIFDTIEKAKQANVLLENLSGFKDYKDAFVIIQTELNNTEWFEGFRTIFS